MNAKSEVSALTVGPKHHWFGYYDKTPWSFDHRFVLCMESDFADRPPVAGDRIRLGVVDTTKGNRMFEPFAETAAWCWQTGCMLQWLPGSGRRVVYNTREGNHFAAVVHDLDRGDRKVLPLPVFCVTPDGRTALSINFSRLARYRPGYGYAGVPDPFEQDLTPEKDGIWRMDLASGRHELILPTAAAAATEPTPEMAGVAHRFNHVQVNTTGTRFGVLHRFMRRKGAGDLTRLLTANIDGSEVCVLNPNRLSSHYDWRDGDHLLIWARVPGTTIDAPKHCYIVFTDKTKEFELFGEGDLPEGDGHCSYSPDRRWVLTDTYPSNVDQKQTLILYHPGSRRRVDIGRFLHPPPFGGEYRCDLHPRWNRYGTKICFDSVCDGTRQLYAADVKDVVR
ncbi:MAG: hypothetical protein C0404_01970 [Verrucomicrobia bacterium]|nr:hypothetical protein [Verrucomicrobiota bacterium]